MKVVEYLTGHLGIPPEEVLRMPTPMLNAAVRGLNASRKETVDIDNQRFKILQSALKRRR